MRRACKGRSGNQGANDARTHPRNVGVEYQGQACINVLLSLAIRSAGAESSRAAGANFPAGFSPIAVSSRIEGGEDSAAQRCGRKI